MQSRRIQITPKHIDQAIAEFQRAIEISGHSGVLDSSLAYVYAVLGRKEEATKIAQDLEAQREQNPSVEANIALIYVGLGDQDQAMIWLNKGYEARFNPSILLRPAFDSLRSDARFKELLRRVGLPGMRVKSFRDRGGADGRTIRRLTRSPA
jgi:tetratricopeptide (TPR) repeat protein